VTTINDLEPKPVWQLFKQICDIPHPSYHELKLRDHIRSLCDQRGLETQLDEVGNLIVKKPATSGMENRKTIAMQGHVDMVPQKNADSNHNFETDPIETWVDGEWLKAKGTTLGSDNGMGVAAGLAVMLSDDIPHGALELLCTIEEETSMRGAFGLKPGYLDADILLNLDTEDEGELYVGCAGGVDINSFIDLQLENTPNGHIAFEVAVRGLKGGHSGLDIEKGRGNANQIINRFILSHGDELGLCVSEFNGGTLRNAIPRESFTKITIPTGNQDDFNAVLKDFESLMQSELGATEPNLSITAEAIDTPEKIINPAQLRKICLSIAACVSAPFRMSDHFDGIVETSNNLAIVKNEGSQLKIQCLTRSLVNSARDYAAQSIAATFELAGANSKIEGAYPGWKPNPDSAILQTMIQGYQNLFGTKPEVKVIHAGLECGLIGEPYPELDMISFGPTIRGAHSPDERCHIGSVQKFWDYLLYSLENAPAK